MNSRMEWNKLMTDKRLKAETYENLDFDARNEFQRDTDRIVFSSSFRRLQDKTQVFPLPINDFVHTRLTHSLEVASVGRSLGKLVGSFIVNKGETAGTSLTSDDFGNVVSAACYSHDIGNPPFGHSGEKAIGTYFTSEKGKEIIKSLSLSQKFDLEMFEGNAAGFRILTNDHPSMIEGGLRLTYATLGAFSKYPTSSVKPKYNELGISVSKRKSHSKFGYFQSESAIMEEVANECGLIQLSASDSETKSWCRHPLTFLMEAADTICYYIIDLEDGHKIKIISTEEAEELLFAIVNESPDTRCDKNDWRSISHPDERIGALRAKAINTLAYESYSTFKENYEAMMMGTFDKEIPDIIHSNKHLEKIKEKSIEHLYNHLNVVEVELAGYKVLGGLVDIFLGAVLNPKQIPNNKLLKILPKQFQIDNLAEEDIYLKAMKVCDYVSRMTDSHAIDLYRKLMGIELPNY